MVKIENVESVWKMFITSCFNNAMIYKISAQVYQTQSWGKHANPVAQIQDLLAVG